MSEIDIGQSTVGTDRSAFVIAEAGSNHNGDLEKAERLIEVAAEAGVDAVKFQTFRAADLYVEDSGDAEYLDDDRSVYDLIESMEMPYEWIPRLSDHCQANDVCFLSTPFDEHSADELEPHLPAYKVASYTMSHHPFLRYLASKDKPIIMSTGAHELSEVRESLEVLRQAGAHNVVLLHCVASYPTPLESINVRALQRLREEFDVCVGLSDHTLDPTVAPAAAVSLGADVVEKHFTLDKSMEGPDHAFALEPDELAEMVSQVRKTERALGDGEVTVMDVEEELYDIARRRIHASCDIEPGETLTSENVKVLRSGKQKKGLDPGFYEEILGLETSTAIEKGEGITWDDVDR